MDINIYLIFLKLKNQLSSYVLKNIFVHNFRNLL